MLKIGANHVQRNENQNHALLKIARKNDPEDNGGCLKEFEYIGIPFAERRFVNKLLYLVYKVSRFFFISLWFYFAPFYGFYAYDLA